MKSLSSIVGLALGALLMFGCGDSTGVGGGGGNLVCASDNNEFGETIDCPGGAETIDFCVNTRSGNCYYLVGGEEANCGNCFESNFNVGNCAQEAVALCN